MLVLAVVVYLLGAILAYEALRDADRRHGESRPTWQYVALAFGWWLTGLWIGYLMIRGSRPSWRAVLFLIGVLLFVFMALLGPIAEVMRWAAK